MDKKMTDIVLATFNPKKAIELNTLLKPLEKTIVPLSNYSTIGADETGATFVENALLKARFATQCSGLPALADDSGLVVPALGGDPGVYSARYAGENASDADNRAKLLEAMKPLKGAERNAFFVCMLVFLRSEHDPLPLIIQGLWEGRIAESEKGENGFGYDPIFWVQEHNCTSAELRPEIKNSLSHRGKAMAALLKQMRAFHV